MNGPQPEDEFANESSVRPSNTIVELVYDPELHRKMSAAAAKLSAARATRERSPRRAAPRSAEPAPESAIERHQRKCVICAHPEREDIDELYLHWHSPRITALQFAIPLRALHRHAHATGLYSCRQDNLRSALDRILERADEATITGESIIRAVRAYTCLTRDNNWVEPPSRVVFSSTPASPARPEPAEARMVAIAASAGQNLLAAPSAITK